ncbi:MAG: tetratricopeptide repeat protein [Bacteroides sp.]|nr:tetratricopeptide repeat protein [Bacteroides sp.]
MEQVLYIKELIQKGETEEAIGRLNKMLAENCPNQDEVYYLLGNAYRKTGNWQQALNNYQYAIELNAESPAVEARSMLMDILNFFNKDMYNQ